MTDPHSPENAPTEDRTPDGRFARGNSLGTPFGPDNPPPRSPGRPRKDAWIAELEQRLEDPRMRQALADRILRIALQGSERAALQAAQLIQDRVGGPVTQRVEAEVDVAERRLIILIDPRAEAEEPPMPESVLEIERAEERARTALPDHT